MGGDPSQIFGQLTANGQVWLINPNGIVFGRSARVDVAGLLATTLDISNTDFMAGTYRFNATGAPAASVTNAGRITIRDAGLAALVAPSVANSGVIEARLGRIQLSSAEGFTLDFYGDGKLNFLLDQRVSEALAGAEGDRAAVSNSGALIADGGEVFLTADVARSVVDQAINMDGYIQARSIGSRTGSITLDGGDEGGVRVSGKIDASGRSSGEGGGEVAVTGQDVELTSTARVDASGDAGGGTALLGGDYRGGGDLRAAETTLVAKGALIRVDAVRTGDGGKAIVWANGQTAFSGLIIGRGGLHGGDGGFAEVSGRGRLDFDGKVDLRALAGRNGTLLLDPRNITIQASGTTTTTIAGGSGTTFTGAVDSSVLTTTTLQNALALGNVMVVTAADGTQEGDITVASNLSWLAPVSGNTLTLNAYRNIVVNTGVTISASGPANLVMRSDSTGTGIGTVTFNGTGRVNFGSSTGVVLIYYNPTSYASPTDYRNWISTRNGSSDGLLQAYMLVNNVNDLQNINLNMQCLYALGRDVDASGAGSLNGGAGFAPIGNSALAFIGIFDGLGHTISNLTISTPSAEFTGLFGYIRQSIPAGFDTVVGGTVGAFTLSNVLITPRPGPGGYVGAVAGYNEGYITNVTVTGIVNGTYRQQVGGVVGLNEATGSFRSGLVSNSVSSAAVSAGLGSNVGGLVGKNLGRVQDSSASGHVTGYGNATSAGAVVGGLVGFNGKEIAASFSTGSVEGNEGVDVGGAGWLERRHGFNCPVLRNGIGRRWPLGQ